MTDFLVERTCDLCSISGIDGTADVEVDNIFYMIRRELHVAYDIPRRTPRFLCDLMARKTIEGNR